MFNNDRVFRLILSPNALHLALALLVANVACSAVSPQQDKTPSGSPPGSPAKEVRILQSPASPDDETIRNLISSTDQAVRNRDYGTAAQLLEQVVSLNPNYKNAWNYLGWTYNALGKYQKAEEVLRKAIAVNPDDQSAYNNLGQALAFQKRYEEAISQYLKQIELRPKDPWAHANLGRIYIITKQYEKAVSSLETASTISPNDPSIPFNLGRAYAKLDQPEKAVQAFEKSVQLQPAPSRWNSVAYEMAVAKLNLAEAEKFSLSSIAATVTQMRDTSLDHITREDITLASRLAANWDTWGWIRFQEGDLKEAEKYIRSAWQIFPVPAVDNHLGQINEKNGNKEEAVRYYQMALAILPTETDSRERLGNLVGSDKNLDMLAEEGHRIFKQARTVALPNSHNAEGFADFWVLLSPGPIVKGVKFVSGDDDLRPLAKDLESFAFPNCFPEATELRLVRRVRLSCVHAAPNCNLQFIASQEAAAEDVPAAMPSVAGGFGRIQLGGSAAAAKLLNKVQPIYPELARQQRIQGVVRLKTIIGVDGTIQQLELISGHPLLVQAAMDAVRQWRYQPILVNGKPVEVETTIDVYFQLQ